MAYNDLPTANEIESSPETKQPGKTAAQVLVKFFVYLIAGILVAAITVLVFLFG